MKPKNRSAFLFFLFFLICCPLFAGNEVGGNGDGLSGWITSQGRHILIELKRREALGSPLDPKLTSEQFSKALETRLVIIDKTNRKKITSAYGEVKDVKLIPASESETKEPLLLINEEKFNPSYLKKKADYLLVFHGYLYACGMDDSRYEISSKLKMPPPSSLPLNVFKKHRSLDRFILGSSGIYLATANYGDLLALDANGEKSWEKKDISIALSLNSIRETRDGNFLVAGRKDQLTTRGAIGDKENRLMLSKIKPDGSVLWSRDFCDDTNFKENKACLGAGIVDVLESTDGTLIALVQGFTDNMSSYVLTFSSTGLKPESKSVFFKNKRLRYIRPTQDGGYLLSGYASPKVEWHDIKADTHQFSLVKLKPDFSTAWERTLINGKGGIAIELSTKKIVFAGSKHTGKTTSGDLVTESALLWLDEKGENPKETSLFFIDKEVDDPRTMGTQGEIGSLFEDEQGKIWALGSNNIFEREKAEVSFGNLNFHIVEKNGFVSVWNSSEEEPRFTLFPGIGKLSAVLDIAGWISLSGERFFAKTLASELSE